MILIMFKIKIKVNKCQLYILSSDIYNKQDMIVNMILKSFKDFIRE